MYLVNEHTSPKYSRLANKTINPGCRSRDLPDFAASYRQIKDKARGFKVRLSEEDLKILREIVNEWVVGELMEVEALGIDPDENSPKASFDRLVDRIIDKRKYKQRSIAVALANHREKEARIQAESNYIDESGNPVNDRMLDQAVQKDIEPELHPEMDNDLSKVLANNLAIMRTASGKPIENKPGVVAGSTVVPTDPKWYQKNKGDVPPGMPDFGKNIVEGEKMKAAAMKAPGVPQ